MEIAEKHSTDSMNSMSTDVSWDDQRAFLAVVEEGSLSGAARRLRVAQPTVRARIAALEQALNLVLFTRSVRGLVPTEHAYALRMLREPWAGHLTPLYGRRPRRRAISRGPSV